ncbi:412_t:CDS:2 [Ambispora leptoticha]|uniref:412_t:CDS:1 n=1 Tax=Ambispora leptoticha TaxID=144679 RepID=A0A9N8V9J8_9GLOM|nr:412_t:CDS:2 [Ambispora leptoticha]
MNKNSIISGSQMHEESTLLDDDNCIETDTLSFISLDYENNHSSPSSLFEREFLDDDDIYSFLRVEYYGTCSTCNRFNTSIAWCQTCDPEILDTNKNSKRISTDNQLIEHFVKEALRKSESYDEYLEYIPFHEFADVKYVGSGRFSSVFSAVYSNGARVTMNENGVWKRRRSGPVDVALKVFDQGSVEINRELLRKLEIYYKHWKSGGLLRCFGISESPGKSYIILVSQLASGGNLRDFLRQPPKEYEKMNWLNRLKICKQISWELNFLHNNSYVHGNLHCGNILWDKKNNKFHISDFAISPQKSLYTKESDVYDLGLLMWDIIYLSSLFGSSSGNGSLTPLVPKCINDLLERCWDAKPQLRLTARGIHEVLKKWVNDLEENRETLETVADNKCENCNINESLLLLSENSGNGSNLSDDGSNSALFVSDDDDTNSASSANDETSELPQKTIKLYELNPNNDSDDIAEFSRNTNKTSSFDGNIDTRFAGDSDTLVGGGVVDDASTQEEIDDYGNGIVVF